METTNDVRSGPLRMDENGMVRLRVDGGDGADVEFEKCGPVFDPDLCPPGLEAYWEGLLRLWNQSAGGGHEPEAKWSYYERLSIPRMN